MKKNLIIVFTTLFLSNFLVAQKRVRCGSELLNDYLMNVSPEYVMNRSNIQNNPQTSVRNKSADPIKIPVVVHVIYRLESQNISDEQIQSQIDVLNKDYNKLNWDTIKVPAVWKPIIADVGIEFVLANRDPSGNVTTGVTRKKTSIQNIASTSGNLYYQSSKGGQDIWDRDRYLNIWVCEILENIYGFASLPGAPAASDGVVIDFIAFGTEGTAEFPTDLGRTATHEIAHWLDLQHLWAFVSVPPCGDDGLLDTPLQEEGNFDCMTYPHKTDCNQTNDGEMFMNFMDYSDDPCLNFFTLDQKGKMIATLNNARSSILTSDGYNTIREFERINLKVYPSPANDQVFIELPQELEIRSVEIRDLNGRQMITDGVRKKELKLELNVSGLSEGLFFLIIHTDKASYSEKILISRHR